MLACGKEICGLRKQAVCGRLAATSRCQARSSSVDNAVMFIKHVPGTGCVQQQRVDIVLDLGGIDDNTFILLLPQPWLAPPLVILRSLGTTPLG